MPREHFNWCQKKLKRQILKTTKKNDGMAFHHHSTEHKINFDGTEIIAEEKSYWRIDYRKLGDKKIV